MEQMDAKQRNSEVGLVGGGDCCFLWYAAGQPCIKQTAESNILLALPLLPTKGRQIPPEKTRRKRRKRLRQSDVTDNC